MSITKDQLIEHISNMTVLELSELVKELEEKFGVSAAAASLAVAAAPAGDAPAEEEKTEFDVALKSFGAEKIKVIKEVRAITSLGLKEAKELVESAGADCFVKRDIPKVEAQEIVDKLQAVGAEAAVV